MTLDEVDQRISANQPSHSASTVPAQPHSSLSPARQGIPQDAASASPPINAQRRSQSALEAPQVIEIVDKRSPPAKASDLDKIKQGKAKIVELRSEKTAPFVRNGNVVAFVIGQFLKRGKLLHDGVRGYVFLHDARVLLPLEQYEEGLELALFDYGLFPQEEVTRNVIDGLRLTARKSGTQIEVHSFTFFDRNASAVYIYDFAGGVYVVRPDGITHCDNGTNGILFIQNPKWAPFELPRHLAESADWQAWLVQGINFSSESLRADDSRILLALWILSLFFPQRFPTRPILALIGQKGCGKSSLLRRLGQLLFGPQFNVTALTSKADDFDAAITTDPLVIADNADDAPNWFADKLAVVATGGTIKRRTYYTTNKLVDFPIRASVGVTSRTPDFQREDVAERLLPLKLDRIEDFGPEHVLLADVQKQRAALLAAIVRDVYLAVVVLDRCGNEIVRSRFRMADFADFALRVAPVVAKSNEVEALLSRLSNQQMSFAIQDDPIFALIDQWLVQEGEHVNVEREIPTTQLGPELEAVAAADDVRVPWERGNSKSFGQYFRTRTGTLQARFQMKARSAHGGATVVSFKPAARGGMGDLGEKSSPLLLQYEDQQIGGQE